MMIVHDTSSWGGAHTCPISYEARWFNKKSSGSEKFTSEQN
jgi:uncharacterized protein YodC (DUF2158 family)